MEGKMVGKDVWKRCIKMEGWYESQRMEEEKACALPKHVLTCCYYASSMDHEHEDESGMNKG